MSANALLDRTTTAARPVGAVPVVDSALYEGTVRHVRVSPRHHGFDYTMAQPFVRLDRIDEFLGRSRWWSRRRFSPVSFRREDYLGDPGITLDAAVRDLVVAHGHDRPVGPIAMLGHFRTFGWCFNPVTAYYCYDRSGTTVQTQVLDVMNTPWGERHAYVIRPDHPEAWRSEFAKELHVSPFMPMHQRYRLRSSRPGETLSLGLSNLEGDRVVFDASLYLERRPPTAHAMRSLLWRYPLMTFKVTAAIHWQALRLALKRVPFRAHPDTPARRKDRS